jgi:ankyrin repeat protein
MGGHIEVVRLLLNRGGTNIDAVDSAGLTPLQLSVQNAHTEVVKLLLERGKPLATPNIDAVDSAGRTPLHLAVMAGSMTIVGLLLEWEGINIDAVDNAGRTPLQYSVQNGHTEVMKLLLKKGKPLATFDYATLDYNRKCGFFEDLLRLATKSGHVETVKELLERPKLDVNAQDNEKMTPLLYAIKARNVDMVKVLCQKDKFDRLRATEENSFGAAPLQIVVEDKNRTEHRNLKVIEKVLLERPEVKDFVDRLYRDRQVFVDAANALLVGAALIASVTFAGWLQPPLGYTPYYDFSQPFPAPPGAYESYAAIKQNPKVKAFWVFNSLSFFFAIATVLAGADAAMPSLDDAFIARVVKSMRRSLIVASILLVMSVVCVLGAFASGGFAVLPPVLKYDTSMIITVCVGGTVCMIILAKFLWKLAKAIRKKQ